MPGIVSSLVLRQTVPLAWHLVFEVSPMFAHSSPSIHDPKTPIPNPQSAIPNPQSPIRPRRIAVVTGTRAEYGLLTPVMDAVAARTDLHLDVIVTGMHLLRRFGSTVRQIVKDGRPIAARVPMQRGDDHPLDQARGLARGVSGIAAALEKCQTDVTVVLGDRIEALAGALAAVATGRFVAHLHGGESAPGDLDNTLRGAITKLAHLHFAATAAARRRIIALGEPARRVYFVGAPGLDRLRALAAAQSFPKPRTNHALVAFHPTGRPPERERRAMADILRAVRSLDLRTTILAPNTDRGHTGILAAIDAYCAAQPAHDVRFVPSLAHDAYLQLLIASDVIVGNSSSGIIEAGAAGTPAVNVGDRQQGREPNGPAVIDADESYTSLQRAIQRALRLRVRPQQAVLYGRRPVGPRIAAILAGARLDEALRRKTR